MERVRKGSVLPQLPSPTVNWLCWERGALFYFTSQAEASLWKQKGRSP